MKKLLSILVVAIATFMMVSCFANAETATFEISGYPKATYTKGEEFAWDGLSINVDGATYTYKDAVATQTITINGTTVTFGNGKTATISEVPTCTSVGTKTVTITYDGGVSVHFQYTVLDSYFANGDGNALTPYQISTVEQFFEAMRTQKSTTTYFEIVNDIDFSNETALRDCDATNVYIDGNGYALRGVNHQLGRYFANSTLKNVNIYFDSEENDYSITKYGLIVESTAGTCLFENINTFGFAKLQYTHSALFGGVDNNKDNTKAYTEANITIKNCNNYATIYAFGIAAGLLTSGQVTKGTTNYYIVNYKNYGTYVAQSCGFIAGSESYLRGNLKYYIDAQTQNYGNFINIARFKAEFNKTTNTSLTDNVGVKPLFMGCRLDDAAAWTDWNSDLNKWIENFYDYGTTNKYYGAATTLEDKVANFNNKLSVVEQKYADDLNVKLNAYKDGNNLYFVCEDNDVTFRISLNTSATCHVGSASGTSLGSYISKAVFTGDYTLEQLNGLKLSTNMIIKSNAGTEYKAVSDESGYTIYSCEQNKYAVANKTGSGSEIVLNIAIINASKDVVGYVAIDGDAVKLLAEYSAN